jgi:hypothetical protein
MVDLLPEESPQRRGISQARNRCATVRAPRPALARAGRGWDHRAVGARHAIVFASIAAALLVAVPAGSGQDIGFCAAATHVAKGLMSNTGVTGAGVKASDYRGGTVCQYGGTHGMYIEKVPHVTLPSFKAEQQSSRGTAVTGVGTAAFSTPPFNGYVSLHVLKGTTEIVIGSKAKLAADVAAAKVVLTLVH